ncbi:Zinc finger, C2H2 domain-containing protein [Rozella allomycis CSF55]|uniref:Zinc finger, C2H2 domain-containing protein n=1 Tax=Rozella allomycis (strain CSF55) TaxID=988480 RepID=A0A075AY08_ROZAC|nr:Zinc finger, C2H2 domain-containing protein [Rozella allomycis CSF55]|eukprot:EPZ35195.1 Zinc finger, C2H2 domain-containing protein [Rozella allomycis CSF55]
MKLKKFGVNEVDNAFRCISCLKSVPELSFPGFKDRIVSESILDSKQPLFSASRKKYETCKYCKKEYENSFDFREHIKSDEHVQALKEFLHAEKDRYQRYNDFFPFVFFSHKDQVLAMYRHVLNLDENIYRLALMNKEKTIIEKFSVAHKQLLQPSSICIILLQGGYFASAIYSVPGCKVIAHKSLHKYTTRKKQGGSQASYDKGGKKPKSAGANLRRQNEKHLEEQDILKLLGDWKVMISECYQIYFSAPGINANILFKFFQKNDSRITKIPFEIEKPNFQQVQMCFNELKSLFVLTELDRIDEIKVEK